MDEFDYVKDIIKLHRKYSLHYLSKKIPEIFEKDNFLNAVNDESIFLETSIKDYKKVVNSKFLKFYFLERLKRSTEFINEYLNSLDLSINEDDKFDIVILRDTLLKRIDEIGKITKFKKCKKMNFTNMINFASNVIGEFNCTYMPNFKKNGSSSSGSI